MHRGFFRQILSENHVALKINWISFNKIGKKYFQILKCFFANFKVPFNSNLPLWSATSAGKRNVLATSRVNVVHTMQGRRKA